MSAHKAQFINVWGTAPFWAAVNNHPRVNEEFQKQTNWSEIMSAKTSAARVLAAQRHISTAKTLGENAALKDDASSDGSHELAILRKNYTTLPALGAIAEGAYFNKLQDLRGETTA